MRCIKCGHQMKAEAEIALDAEVRGETFSVSVVASQCSHCERVLLGSKGRRAYHRAGTEAYRAAHSLLTTRELDSLRRNLGMTWKEFAEHSGIGIATMKRWISGEIQSPSLDELVRLKADPEYAQKKAAELFILVSQQAPFCEYPMQSGLVIGRGHRYVTPVSERKSGVRAANADYALCA